MTEPGSDPDPSRLAPAGVGASGSEPWGGDRVRASGSEPVGGDRVRASGSEPVGGDRVRVRVPASSANLGPGFDVLAVALDLTLAVQARPHDGSRVVTSGEGAGDLPDDDSNLVWQSVQAFCDVYGADLPDITLHCDNDIPLERGLGSSAAAAVAGLVLARELTGVAVGDQDIIDLAAQLEGHADNAAAAVLGGLVVAGPTGRARRFEPTRNLRPVVCIPPERSATTMTRGLLPSEVSLDTMVGTARRTALVLAGLTGMTAWDPSTMTDEVHEPPRLEIMPRSRELVTAARDAGYGACLSGAGPSVLIFAPSDDTDVDTTVREVVGADWRIELLHWDRAGARRDEPATSAT
jgi:homoserine kinase